MPLNKMAFTEKTSVAVAMATLAIMAQYCSGYSTCNVSVKREPEGGVELIELMLPHHFKNGDENINDYTKTSASAEEPRFEIFIKQNKNRRDMKISPKIKIFVESDEYGSEKSLLKTMNGTSNGRGSKREYQPVPLTIQASGANVDRQTEKEPFGGVSGKSQMHLVIPQASNISFVRENEGKEQRRAEIRPQTMKNAGKRMETFGSEKKNDDRDRKSTLKTEEDSFLTSKATKAFEVGSRPESTTRKEEPEILKAAFQESFLYESPKKGERERHHHHHHRHEQPFETSPTAYNKDDSSLPVEKELVYEPDAGISATHANTFNGKRFAENPRILTGYADREERNTGDLEYEEARSPGSERRLTNGNSGGRPIREESSPGRNRYLDNGHSETRSSNNGYTRDGVQYSVESRPGRSDGRYSSEGKRIYNSDNLHYTFDPPEDAGGVLNTEVPYQLTSHKDYSHRYETTTHHPIRQSLYSGFPESHTGNAFESSRQTPYEGPSDLPGSPCPTVFKYTKHESDRWYADIYVTTDVVLNGMRLDLLLNKRADILAAFSAEVKSTDNLSFTILSLKKTLVPGTPEVVQIIVKYNSDGGRTAPFVKTISLNGRMICPPITNVSPKTTTKRPTYAFPGDIQEPKRTTERIPVYTRPAVNEYITTTLKPSGNFKRTTPSDLIPAPNPDAYEAPDYSDQSRPATKRPYPNRPVYSNKPTSQGLSNNDNRRPISPPNNNNYEDTVASGSGHSNNRKPSVDESRNVPCGLPAVQPRPLITNGQKTARGQWPWHAAIYRNVGPNLSYSCGGSLVTNLHVVTAAHCATVEYSTTPVEPKMLLVYFGKYHLRVWTENGIANREVARVNVHPNYNATDFRSDIAVLTLAKRVEFTDFIRPVCLWDRRNTRIEDIVGLAGSVVGWGFDETKELTEELKQAKMPVVKHNECLWSYPDFYPKFTSNTTYCAGFKNGTSVCNGDSGGGMVFPIKVNREDRWFLRGLVSLSPGLKDTRVCDTHQYVVFTDVAKFLPWLEDLIS